MNPADPHPAPSAAPGDPDITRTTTGTNSPSLAFGPYRLLQRIGEGGMGEVWLAEQVQPLRRQVALKVIKAGMDTAQVVARFEAERQALAVMDHPAIARVFDAGATPEGRPYFAMEYVRGEPLTAYCDRHRLTTDERLELFLQVCDGVQHAHQKAIIHRDLKPSNVLVTLQGDRPVPKIIDFGLAKATTPHLTERSLFTEVGALIGTPEYMSPEQAEMGGLDIDTRTDVYALGVILYELLTGGLPFDGNALRQQGLDEIRRTIRDVEPLRPSTRISKAGSSSLDLAQSRRTEPARLVSRLRGDLDWITMRALEKDRTRRYQTANALAADIRRSLSHEPVTAGPPSLTYRMGKFVRRHRIGVAAATLMVATLVSAVLVTTGGLLQARRARDLAAREALMSKEVSDFMIDLFRISDPSEARGRSISALEILERGARSIDESLAGQPEVKARLMSVIGDVYTALGVYKEAEPLLRQAITLHRDAVGPTHIDTVRAVHRLANALWYLERAKEAEPLYDEAVSGYEESLGANDPETLRAKFDLASVYGLSGRWKETEELTVEVLSRQRQVLGDRHLDTLKTMGNLAFVYLRTERLQDAEQLWSEVLRTARQVLGVDHPETLATLHNLAFLETRLGKFEDAERHYLELVQTRASVLGASHPSSVRSTAQFVDMYEAWGKPAKAAEWRTKLTREPAPGR